MYFSSIDPSSFKPRSLICTLRRPRASGGVCSKECMAVMVQDSSTSSLAAPWSPEQALEAQAAVSGGAPAPVNGRTKYSEMSIQNDVLSFFHRLRMYSLISLVCTSEVTVG